MNDTAPMGRGEPPISSTDGQTAETLLRSGSIHPPGVPGTLGTVDRFVLLRPLGRGGMGQVFLAREPVTDSEVAVKMLQPECAANPSVVHRFLTEARHMYRMSHPNILKVLEVSDRAGGSFFVMPYVRGGSLADRIRPGQPLASDLVLSVARQVAEALHYAHGEGIIHRDIKPSNVLVDAQGRAYLTDFGLMRTVFNDSLVEVAAPRIEGTPPYMSPATAEGKAEDTRCDIYAFGCLLYEMLAGAPPYEGPTLDSILQKVRSGPPRPIRQVAPRAPADLVRIAEGAMARELRDRYATMADVLFDLERVARGEVSLGPHGRARESLLNPYNAIGIAVAFLVVAALAAAYVGIRARIRAANKPAAAAPALPSSPGGQAGTSVVSAWVAHGVETKTEPAAPQPAPASTAPATAVEAKAGGWRTALDKAGVRYRSVTAWTNGLCYLDVSRTDIADLTPLKGLPLASLNAASTRVNDLTPLAGMPLQVLDVGFTSVSNIACLKGMPLVQLDASETKVSDLSPLAGSPLKMLNVCDAPVSDLSPLKQTPIEWISLHGTQVTDLRPLAGRDLVLICVCKTGITDLSPLQGMKRLRRIHGLDSKSFLSPIDYAIFEKDYATARQRADDVVAKWQDVPAMSNVVQSARDLLVRIDGLQKTPAAVQ
jgi:serine/threonine-protein kinase